MSFSYVCKPCKTVTFPKLSINIKTNEGVNNIAFIDESEGVNEELNVVYKLIDNTPGLKAPDVAKLLDKSLSAAERYIKKLKNAGLIEFRGAPKTGGYFLK